MKRLFRHVETGYTVKIINKKIVARIGTGEEIAVKNAYDKRKVMPLGQFISKQDKAFKILRSLNIQVCQCAGECGFH